MSNFNTNTTLKKYIFHLQWETCWYQVNVGWERKQKVHAFLILLWVPVDYKIWNYQIPFLYEGKKIKTKQKTWVQYVLGSSRIDSFSKSVNKGWDKIKKIINFVYNLFYKQFLSIWEWGQKLTLSNKMRVSFLNTVIRNLCCGERGRWITVNEKSFMLLIMSLIKSSLGNVSAYYSC